MKPTLLIALLVTSLFAASCAAHVEPTAPEARVVLASASADEPATQPAQLPAGHPDISAMMGGAAEPSTQPAQPALPAGHPDISSMMGGGGGTSGGAQLPAGHPDISQMMGGGAPPPATGTTSVIVKVAQGTIGGPTTLGGLSGTVEVYDRDRVVAKLDAKLNERGEVTVSGIPVGPTFQPLVTVTYKDVTYQAAGQPIASATPQTVTVQVYEPTDQPVGWEVRMRHVMLHPSREGVQVIDMLAIDNATDRAFIGAAGSDGADGRRMTFALPIPAGARDVKLVSGFHDCCSKVEHGYVASTMAIVPGTTQYQLTYFVPQRDGKTEVTTSAPAVTKHFIAFAPDDGTTITASGLETGTTDMGGGTTRYFKASAVPADQVLKMVVSGAPTKSPPATEMRGDASRTGGSPVAVAGATMDPARIAKTVAGLGGLLIFLIGGAWFFRRPGNNMAGKQPDRA
jgi:hypothetical protein